MGLEIGIGWLTFWMFGSLIFLLLMGLPLAFVTGGLGVVFLFIFGDLQMLHILPSRIFPFMTDYQLSAIPLFIFMASVLAAAGLIEELFDVVYKILGGLKGGLATATIIAATILAAMVGVIGAAEVTMGIIALPAMLKRKYDPALACGAILAGGTLGILIPPSILAILFAVVAQQSVGELFIGAFFPGFLLSGMYIIYVTARSYMNPAVGPALPKEERVSVKEKLFLLRGIIAPILLVFLVLGVIFTGVATPVEAAGIGTFGALVVAALSRRLSWTTIYNAAITTLKASTMVLWIMFGASIFVGFYIVNGGQEFVTQSLLGTDHHDDPFDPFRHVSGLGGDFAAGGTDFRSHHALTPVGRRIRPAGGQSGGCIPVVRGGLYGEHADVVFESALRIRAFLSEKRGAAEYHHGDHIQGVGTVSVFAGHRAGPGGHLSRDYFVAAEACVRPLRGLIRNRLIS